MKIGLRYVGFALPAAVAALLSLSTPALSAGEAERGATVFRACAACHSLRADRNMTGPSLAGVWGRKAGGLASFERYSPALKASGMTWGAATLDAWIKSPKAVVANTTMTFPGIADAQQRDDLIAFLREVTNGHRYAGASDKIRQAIEAYSAGFDDLKKLGPDQQVSAIRYCHAAYVVATADGQTHEFWEANLRFKTDSSDTGPLPGKPVMMPAGMAGDRASVFFTSPDEISTFVKHC
jgi:cytochrome c